MVVRTEVNWGQRVVYLAFFGMALWLYSLYVLRSSATEPWDYAVTLAGGALIPMSFILLAYCRDIGTVRLHLLQLGDVLPPVSETTRRFPEHGWRYLKALRNRPSPAQRDHDFDLVARLNDPNVRKRLSGYAVTRTRISYGDYDWGMEALASAYLPARRRMSWFAKRQSRYHAEKSDLWPLVRLMVSRLLYKPAAPKKALINRNEEEIGKKPEIKGAHYLLSFKLNLFPLSIWLLLLSTASIAPALATDRVSSKTIAGVFALIILTWGMWTIVYNRTLLAHWKKWLAESGSRPLGNLPLLLYAPSHAPHLRWEELDDGDFRAYLDEYLMDTSVVFQVVLGTFVGTAATFSRFLV